MAPMRAIWTRIIYVLDFIVHGPQKVPNFDTSTALQVPIKSPEATTKGGYPIYNPPDDLDDVADPTFICKYPDYRAEDGWVSCNTNGNRACWIRNTKTGQTYDIDTNYEIDGPKGIVREYYLEVSESTRNPDGAGDVYVQLFNGSFPGPRLQACWGDEIRITINNTLLKTASEPGNGTTVHWHGFRQWKTGQMDGVNAVTQCPIAPGETFTYVFNATQYGTSWYHSHYSLQYAAGLLGAFTVYGPMSHSFDHQVAPIILSDWLHMPVFEKWEWSMVTKCGRIYIDNMLQNGIGQWPLLNGSEFVPEGTKFNEVVFQRGVRYLMRIINGAADTTFVFSIDNHSFWVISTDFVSITPYYTNKIVVGIGQRYNIMVAGTPSVPSEDVNFWIRTSPATNCTAFNPGPLDKDCKAKDRKFPQPDGRTGILRYSSNTDFPTTSRQDNITLDCIDETYYPDVQKLSPIVEWNVSETRQILPDFHLDFMKTNATPYYPCGKNTSHFYLVQSHPMWLNFSDPPLLNPTQDFTKKPWLTVIDSGDVPEDAWFQLNIISGAAKGKNPSKPHPIPKRPSAAYFPGQHPIHLHGHDFAVLDQCVPDESQECDILKANLTTTNPPRRDVAFLPDGGYLIIAFKADNPGAWIMHCHIAFHASMGLAAQILENVKLWPKTFLPGWDEPFEDMCRAWDKWSPDDASDPCMYLNPDVLPLQTDSGI
ncbi:hypothetical protein BST61_g8582 [Cercospora zeina]